MAIAVGVVLVAAIVFGIGRYQAGDSEAAPELTVGWGGSEGQPSCEYNAKDSTVDALLTLDGHAPSRTKVTVTVTAYGDENTSQPVGSNTRSVPVEGTVHRSLVVTIAVNRPPHVGEDDETACRLAFEYATY